MLDTHPIDVIHEDVTGVQNGSDGWLKTLEFEGGAVREYEGGFALYGADYNSRLATDLGCELNDDGTVEVDDHGRTSVDGVYAAGDLTPGHNQVPIALGDGAKAGSSIHWTLREFPRNPDLVAEQGPPEATKYPECRTNSSNRPPSSTRTTDRTHRTQTRNSTRIERRTWLTTSELSSITRRHTPAIRSKPPSSTTVRTTATCTAAKTSRADEHRTEQGAPVIPDTFANAGGVTASHFEWVQNTTNEYWTEERVREKLATQFRGAFADLREIETASKTTRTWREVAYARCRERATDRGVPGQRREGRRRTTGPITVPEPGGLFTSL